MGTRATRILFRRVAGLVSMALGIAVIVTVYMGFEKLSISKEEERQIMLCALPRDALLPYLLVEQRWGRTVAEFWMNTQYLPRTPKEVRDHTALELRRLDERQGEIVAEALRVNFGLQANNPAALQNAMIEVDRTTPGNCRNLNRRNSSSSERFDDFLRDIGLATLLAIAVYMVFKLAMVIGLDHSKEEGGRAVRSLFSGGDQ